LEDVGCHGFVLVPFLTRKRKTAVPVPVVCESGRRGPELGWKRPLIC
jgi:hypothetical protein